MRRRAFLHALGSSVALAGCLPRVVDPEEQEEVPPPVARLTARPGSVSLALDPGMHEILAPSTSGLAYVPEGLGREREIPLLVFLHGANRSIEQFVEAFKPACDSAKVILLAPYSTLGTWDAIRTNGVFGEDVVGIDSALKWVFARAPIGPSNVAISGFSDGATYAIAMGRGNGELFSKVFAFAPGFVLPIAAQGMPPMVVTHGTNDEVLSYAYCRDVIVPSLRQVGHTVDFRSFEGPHAVPLNVANEQIALMGEAPSPF